MRRAGTSGTWSLAACAIVTLVLGGCSPEAARLAVDAASVTAGTTPAPGKPIRIAMIAKSAINPIFLSARTGAEAAARDLATKIGRPIEIVWLTPPLEDANLQGQRIAQAVNESMDAILLSCSDAAKLTLTINAAVARGVPVMTFDADAPQSRRFAFFGVDDRRLGEALGRELIKQIGPRGKIAILAGSQAAANLRQRVEGVKSEVARYPGVQVVGVYNHAETPQDATAEVARATRAHPDIRGWAMVGGWALFTKTLLRDPAPKKVTIVAVDALPPQLAYVVAGWAPVLLAQPAYLWGNVGVVKIIDKLHFKKDVSALPAMEVVKVTIDNLGEWSRQLKQWGFADVPDEYLQLR